MRFRTMMMRSAAMGFAAATLALKVLRRRRLRIDGSAAVVCGASRGLGRAIARELTRRGCKRIAICARTRAELQDTASDLARSGVEVYFEACDLRDESEAASFVGNAITRFGSIDLLVTNAATMSVAPVAVLGKRDFDEAMASTFDSALNPTLAALPTLRAQGRGTIAFVTSIGGRVGVPHLAPYCAAKFAEVGLAEALRAELAADGVHVLTVVPGLMRTGSHVRAEFKGDHEREYIWFAAAATAPLLSIDADRAARRIVSAIARGDSEVSYTLPARIAPRLAVFAPRLWAKALALVARVLPKPRTDARASIPEVGLSIEASSRSRLVRTIRSRSRELAIRHAQVHSG